MTEKPTGRSRRRRRAGPPAPGRSEAGGERRRNRTLREITDDLLDFVRYLARTVPTMSAEEREYAQQRLEWLADEVWRAVVEGVETEDE